MDINTIIVKKRDKQELNKEEIKFFVGKFNKGEITDAQAASLLSYIYTNGLTEDEIINFVYEVAYSGEYIDLSEIDNNIIDKHSTGGVGDKATLILMPLLASLGLKVAKISSKGHGISGGTIDKLCAIPGFNANISVSNFIQNVSKIGISIVSQEINLAPAESKLYKLRNEIACSDSITLIAISLLSLKVASGSNKIVYDLTCGSGSYLKTVQSARRLGKLLVKIGKKVNREVGYVITSMNEPIGKTIGNNLEIQETVKALDGKMEEDLNEIVVSLGTVALALAGKEKNAQIGAAMIKDALTSGKAKSKFMQMVEAQGGDTSYILSSDKFETAKVILPVYAPQDGYISEINCDIVGSIAKFLGVGRTENIDEIDNTAGIVFEKKVGDKINVGETIAYVHSRDENKALRATQILNDAYRISDIAIRKVPRVIEAYGI